MIQRGEVALERGDTPQLRRGSGRAAHVEHEAARGGADGAELVDLQRAAEVEQECLAGVVDFDDDLGFRLEQRFTQTGQRERDGTADFDEERRSLRDDLQFLRGGNSLGALGVLPASFDECDIQDARIKLSREGVAPRTGAGERTGLGRSAVDDDVLAVCTREAEFRRGISDGARIDRVVARRGKGDVDELLAVQRLAVRGLALDRVRDCRTADLDGELLRFREVRDSRHVAESVRHVFNRIGSLGERRAEAIAPCVGATAFNDDALGCSGERNHIARAVLEHDFISTDAVCIQRSTSRCAEGYFDEASRDRIIDRVASYAAASHRERDIRRAAGDGNRLVSVEVSVRAIPEAGARAVVVWQEVNIDGADREVVGEEIAVAGRVGSSDLNRDAIDCYAIRRSAEAFERKLRAGIDDSRLVDGAAIRRREANIDVSAVRRSDVFGSARSRCSAVYRPASRVE